MFVNLMQHARILPLSACPHTGIQSHANSYLPGAGDYFDQQGSAPKVRLVHCTLDELTLATTSNWRGSGAKFLIVGHSVRASPITSNDFSNILT